MNDRSRVFNKGVFFGGNVVPVSGTLTVNLAPFATVGSDGMFVREDVLTTTLAVVDGATNYIIIRQEYKTNAEPVVSVESISEAAYLGEADPDTLIVFATVTVPLAATAVTTSMIDFTERDVVDPLGRLSLRGHLTSTGSLPLAATNANRPGDFYIVSSGASDTPEMWAWNGASWINITQAQTVTNLLEEHIDNLSSNSKHVDNNQFHAILGTSGTPSDSNRYVTDVDARLPTQNENNALFGDNSTLSDSTAPSDTNRYVVGTKLFAVPTEKAFSALASIEITESEGPVYVGKVAGSTAQAHFNIFDTDTTGANRDKELLNSQSRAVRVTGVYIEASLTWELDPGTSANVDDLGFYRKPDGTAGVGSLFLKLSDGDANSQADVPFRIVYGKRTHIQDITPEAFVQRGAQSGQVDARVAGLLETNVNPQFVNAEWDAGTSAGDVIAFNSATGKFVQHDLTSSLYPIGVRGDAHNLITTGIYEFASATAFGAGDEVYAHGATAGALSTTVNEWFIGTFLSSTKLLVNMNAIGLSSTSVAPGITFPASMFDVLLQPGETAYYNKSSNEFERWTSSLSLAPIGVRGYSNNIIQVGELVAPSPTFFPGLRYYAHPTNAGQLTSTANDYFVGNSLNDAVTLVVNVTSSPVWEDAKTTFAVEHNENLGTHDEGSARTWVGLSTDSLTALSGSTSRSTGMMHFATDTGRVYHCTNGATNTWAEVSSFVGPLAVTSTVEVGGNLRLPTGILDDTAGDTFNVFAHATRHGVAGSDAINGIVNQIFTNLATADLAIGTGTPPPTTVLTRAFDFTGRSSFSRILFLAQVLIDNDSTGIRQHSMSFFLDTVELLAPYSIRSEDQTASGSGGGETTMVLFGTHDGITAGPHTMEVRCHADGGSVIARSRMLMICDLGLS
jgi:hypothetical protein